MGHPLIPVLTLLLVGSTGAVKPMDLSDRDSFETRPRSHEIPAVGGAIPAQSPTVHRALRVAESTVATVRDLAVKRWTVQREEEGITISTGEIEGVSILAYKGEMMMNVPIGAVYRVLQDDQGMTRWVHGLERVDLLQEVNSHQFIFLSVNKAPSPLSRRLAILQVRDLTRAESEGVMIHMTGIPTGYDAQVAQACAQEAMVRMKTIEIIWKLMPAGERSTRIMYQVIADPESGIVPAFLINYFMKSAPFETLKGLRRTIAGPPAAPG